MTNACPVCGCSVNQENKSKHIVKVHLNGEAAYLGDALKSYEKSDGNSCECFLCKKKVKIIGLVHHFIKEHNSLFRLSRPEAKPFNEASHIGSVLRSSVKCECGQRIGYVQISNDLFKAFNLDSRNQVTERHVCEYENKSMSVYAFSAGIVDSNRRRH